MAATDQPREPRMKFLHFGKSPSSARPVIGGPCGIRTHDLRIKSPMLCQLS